MGEGKQILWLGGAWEWEPLISAVQHRAVNPLIHWIWGWLCFCGQDRPGMLGFFLGVSRWIMDSVVASTPMLTGTSGFLFEPPQSPDVAFSRHQLCPFLSLSVLHFLPVVSFFEPLPDTQMLHFLGTTCDLFLSLSVLHFLPCKAGKALIVNNN